MKTDYFGIHEKQYKRLISENRSGWMDSDYKNKQFSRLNDLIIKYKNNNKLSILELGCGDAELSIRLAKSGFSISGVDISPTAINWAKSKCKKEGLKSDFRCESVLSTSFADNSFDVIIDSACLHCIIAEDRKKLFSEVNRLLRNDGIFVGETMCNYIPEYFSEFADKDGNIVKNGIAGRYIGKATDIIKEIESSNFTKLETSVNRRKDNNESDDLLYVFKKRK